ncbi:Uncharacterised protein [Amycolatopsis camponoti]|uniref:Uncharacterized protein n=1 Tax=Amycolatopsis camponoti TaxID=2606593 RepID=A0A6I8LK32_9PSEU|nr:Uncharacterised protein [Amycolatopsis camponoti]
MGRTAPIPLTAPTENRLTSGAGSPGLAADEPVPRPRHRRTPRTAGRRS